MPVELSYCIVNTAQRELLVRCLAGLRRSACAGHQANECHMQGAVGCGIEQGLGNPQAPLLQWEVTEPRLALSPATVANLAADHAGQPVWVSQIGIHAASDPLLLHHIP